MRRWFKLVGVSLAIVVVLQVGIAVHRAYGINLPWEVPRHLDLCERRYDDVAPFPVIAPSWMLTIEATLLNLPVPIPDVHPYDSHLPYAGCPGLVKLVIRGHDFYYAPMAGGP